MANSHLDSTAPKSPRSPSPPPPPPAPLASEPSADDIVISLEADEEEEEAIFGESDPHQQEKECQVNDVESSKQQDMLREQELKHQQRLDELREQQERRVREKERMEREQQAPQQHNKRPRLDNDRRNQEQNIRTRQQHRPPVSNSNNIRVGGGRGRGREQEQRPATLQQHPTASSTPSAPRRFSRDPQGYDRPVNARSHKPLPPQQAIVPRSGGNREPLNFRHRSPTPPPFPESSAWPDHSRRDTRRVMHHSRERQPYPKPSDRRDWPKNRQRARSPLPPLPPVPRPRDAPLPPPRRQHHANGYPNDFPPDNYYDRHRQQAGYDHSRANGYDNQSPPPPMPPPPPPSRQYPPLRRQDERRLVDRPPPRRLERGRGGPYRPMYRRNGDFR